MLLVLLCFMTLVGLMVVIKACCQSEMFCRREESPDCSSDSVVQVSVVESTVSAISIPDVVFERSCRMNGNVNDDFIDIDFSLPPSYEEAVKMPLPFRSSSWRGKFKNDLKQNLKRKKNELERTYKYWWSYQLFLTTRKETLKHENLANFYRRWLSSWTSGLNHAFDFPNFHSNEREGKKQNHKTKTDLVVYGGTAYSATLSFPRLVHPSL